MTGNIAAQIVLGVLTFLGGGGVTVALINAFTGRDTRKADTAKSLAEATAVMIEPLQKRLEAETLRGDQQQQQIDRLTKRDRQIDALVDVIPALTKLIDVTVPLIRAEHPDLAAELTAASHAAAAAIPDDLGD